MLMKRIVLPSSCRHWQNAMRRSKPLRKLNLIKQRQSAIGFSPVGDLRSAEVDRVIVAQLVVHPLVELAERAGCVHRDVATVVHGQLLLDDVSFDGDAKVIRLCGGIGSYVIILVFGIYCAVSQIAPQDREHA